MQQPQAEVPQLVSDRLQTVLSDPKNRPILSFIVGAAMASTWEPGTTHDEMMIKEGQRRYAIDLLLAARIDTIDPYFAVNTLGEQK